MASKSGQSSSSERSAPDERSWDSAISSTTEHGISIRGYDLGDLIGQVPFTSAVYLLYAGELPTLARAHLLDALMVASIDHGPGTPSVLAARTVTSGGAGLQPAAAAGLLAMGQFHGAAVTDGMRIVQRVATGSTPAEMSDCALEVVTDYRNRGERLPGYGHRQHKTRDPRVDVLFGLAQNLGTDGRHIAAAGAIEQALETSLGRRLPINIDGVYAAVLSELAMPIEAGNAIFICSRMAGVMAHVVEEQTTMRPMRRIDPTAHRYNGPAHRGRPTEDQTQGDQW